MTNPQNATPTPTATLNPDSDQDNADLLVLNYKDQIRYCTDSRTWFAWHQNKWVIDPEANIVSNYWTLLARKINPFLPQTNNNPPKANPHYKYSLSRRGQEAVIALARRDARIQTSQSEFDSNNYELNTPGGIVDLVTGLVTKSKRTSLHTKETRLTPQSGPSTMWQDFLKDTFQGDQSVTDYVQLILGAALIGEVVEQKFYYAFGPQGTGKSTFFNVIYELLGDYAKYANCNLITKGREKHPEELAKLRGKRLVFMAEPDSKDALDEAKLKWLTGGDMLEGRHMHKESFDFKPAHTMFLYGNYLLNVSSRSEGIFRRMSLIPFENQVWDTDKAVSKFEDILIREEGPQIMQWLIEGTLKYLRSGQKIKMPAQLQSLVKDYEEDQDLFGEFIRERCTIENDVSVTHKQFASEYDLWCMEMGIQLGSGKLGPKQITQALTSKHYGDIRKQKSNVGSKFVGIKLKARADRVQL